jgi:hypothetical protein
VIRDREVDDRVDVSGMVNNTSLISFVRAFGGRWLDSMSGGFSVPLMLVALFVPNRAVAVGTGLLGIVCGVFAAYSVWKDERKRVNEVAALLQKMPLSLGPLREEVISSGPGSNRIHWYIRIDNVSSHATVSNVRMKLTSILPPPRDQRIQLHFPYTVPARGQSTDALSTIHDGDGAEFEVVSGWYANGHLSLYADRQGQSGAILVNRDEHWRLELEVRGERADVLRFALDLRPATERFSIEVAA